MSGEFKAKYISDVFDLYFQKGKVYSGLFYPNGSRDWICYTDDNGEEYALPASRFEIVGDKDE